MPTFHPCPTSFIQERGDCRRRVDGSAALTTAVWSIHTAVGSIPTDRSRLATAMAISAALEREK